MFDGSVISGCVLDSCQQFAYVREGVIGLFLGGQTAPGSKTDARGEEVAAQQL